MLSFLEKKYNNNSDYTFYAWMSHGLKNIELTITINPGYFLIHDKKLLIFKVTYSGKKAKKILNTLDKNGDGELDVDEFCKV